MLTIKIDKKIFLFISMLLICIYLLPYSNILFTGGSFYQSNVGFIYCEGEWNCRHEVGHLIDHDMNDISKTSEFSTANVFHLYYSIKTDNIDTVTSAILSMPGVLSYDENYQPYRSHAGSSPQQELYAVIWADIDGDVNKLPSSFRPLYSDNEKYEEIYQQLLKKHYYISNEGVIRMEEKINKLVEKAKENKELLIRIGLTLAGALVGAGVTAAIGYLQEQSLIEEIAMSPLED